MRAPKTPTPAPRESATAAPTAWPTASVTTRNLARDPPTRSTLPKTSSWRGLLHRLQLHRRLIRMHANGPRGFNELHGVIHHARAIRNRHRSLRELHRVRERKQRLHDFEIELAQAPAVLGNSELH